MDLSVVGADVEHAPVARRLGERARRREERDPVVERRRRGVGALPHDRERAAVDLRREVAEPRPRLAAVARAVEVAEAAVERARVVRRERERRVPVRAFLIAPDERRRRSPVAALVDVPLGPRRADRAPLHRPEVDARQPEVLRRRVERAIVGRVEHRVEAVAAADLEPVLVQDPVVPRRRARPAPVRVVLQAAADAIRHRVVEPDVIELRDGERALIEPAAAAVVRDAEPAVVAFHEVARVLRVHPDDAVVAVQRLSRLAPRLAAVVGHRVLHLVQSRVVARVDEQLARIAGARVVVAHEAPRAPLVVAAIDAAAPLLVRDARRVALALLDRGVDDVRVRAVDGDADAAQRAGRQPVRDAAGRDVRELRPRPPRVGGLPERRAGATADEAERLAAALVGGGVERVRVARVHHDFGDAGVLVALQDELPAAPAVARLVQPALRARRPQLAGDGDVDEVAVRRVRDDARDVAALAEADVRPRAAAVGRLVDAVAPPRALPVRRLAGADPDDVRVALEEAERADRVHALALEHGRQRDRVVGGLPDAAGSARDVDGRRIGFEDGDVGDAAGHRRGADRAEAEGGERRGVLGPRGASGREADGGEQRGAEAHESGNGDGADVG